MSIIDCRQTELYPLSALLHDRATERTVPPEPWTFIGRILSWNSDAPIDSLDVVGPYDSIDVVRRGGFPLHTIPSGGRWEMQDGNVITYTKVEPYWSQFGIEHVELPENCPILTALWERICQRFNEAWYDRFLAGETMEQWQRRLQVITDRTAPRYERALRLYAENKGLLDSAVRMGSTTVYDTLDTSRSRTADTPDTAINEDQRYAAAVTDDEATRTGTVTVNADLLGGAVASLNANIDEWRDLETEFVDEYRAGFLALVWF